jgi:hypothetical protein
MGIGALGTSVVSGALTEVGGGGLTLAAGDGVCASGD